MASLGTSFSTTGATPGGNITPPVIRPNAQPTPQSNALSSVKIGVPSTAIKSQTINPDGSTKVEYHAPAQAPTQAPTSTQTPDLSGIRSGLMNVKSELGTLQPSQPITPAPTPTTTTFPGLLQSIVAKQKELANATAQVAGSGGSIDTQTGRGQIVGQRLGSELTGLETAAGLATPTLGQYGQTFYQPLEAGTEGGQIVPGSEFDNALNQYAQLAANGQISSVPTSITGNPVLSAELNKRAQAINPSYNPVTSAAQGASSADLTTQASSIQAQANGAEANFNLMTNIAKQGGVNNNNVPILNTLQQNVQKGLTSSAAVANFQSLIQSVRSQYAAILGGGTVTVEALQEAQSLIPNDISLSALESLGANLKSDAQNRIAGINEQISTLTGGQTGTTGGKGGGFTEGQTTSSGGYNYVFKGGKWVVAQ